MSSLPTSSLHRPGVWTPASSPRGADVHMVDAADAPSDRAWDAFLAATAGGQYAQSSCWAQAKMLLGWHVQRVVVTHGGQIAAGAQVLIRPLPHIGAVGYVPRGPLVAGDDPQLADLVTTGVRQIARRAQLRYVLVLPPPAQESLIGQALRRGGWRPRMRADMATATARIDLRHDRGTLLHAMRTSTRRNIRLAQRRGITVRLGTEQDLGLFHGLLVATQERQRFAGFPEAYYRGLWRLLHPLGHLHLHVAELAGEPVAASLTIAFGETVTDWASAWSGRHAKAHPNELLVWAAVEWAQARGYRYFDLDGIHPAVAAGVAAPDAHADGGTFFKLGFGGDPVLLPGPYEYLPNPLLRWLYAGVVQSRAAGPLVRRLEQLIRGVA